MEWPSPAVLRCLSDHLATVPRSGGHGADDCLPHHATVRVASAVAGDDRRVSELIVRERRLRGFDQLPRAVRGRALASERGLSTDLTETPVTHTDQRLAARYSRRRIVTEVRQLR